MRSIRKLAAAVLAGVAAIAQAQSPYQILGLHTELVFTDAVALAKKLGGDCQITTSGMQDSGIAVECGYATCNAEGPAGACKPPGGLAFAAQPIVRIGLEAPGESARLTRIVFVYEGSNEIVAESLKNMFGPPAKEPRADEKSWSHSRRLAWTQGIYRIGLLDNPKLLILGADRAQE